MASDNDHVAPHGKEARGKLARYKEALERFRGAVAEQHHAAPAPGPRLVIVAEVYVPNNQVRDAPNFLKALPDGLKGIVITDDRWQVAPRWTVDVVGIDVDRPRCEITIYARS